MYYGISIKTKSQLTNYLNKTKAKAKSKQYTTNTSINTLISDKDKDGDKVIGDYFRKGHGNGNYTGFIKYRTGLNSPDRDINSSNRHIGHVNHDKALKGICNLNKNQSQISNKNVNEINTSNYNRRDHSIELNSLLLSTSNMTQTQNYNKKTMSKEGSGNTGVALDGFFKKKMELMYNKENRQSNSNSNSNHPNKNNTTTQVSNRERDGSNQINSVRTQLGYPLYLRVNKNEVLSKKSNATNSIEEDDYLSSNQVASVYKGHILNNYVGSKGNNSITPSNVLNVNPQLGYKPDSNHNQNTLRISKYSHENKYILNTNQTSLSTYQHKPSSVSHSLQKKKPIEECKTEYQSNSSNKQSSKTKPSHINSNSNTIVLNHFSLSPRISSTRLQSSSSLLTNVNSSNITQQNNQFKDYLITATAATAVEAKKAVAVNDKDKDKDTLIEGEKNAFYNKLEAFNQNKPKQPQSSVNHSKGKHNHKSNSRIEYLFNNPLINAKDNDEIGYKPQNYNNNNHNNTKGNTIIVDKRSAPITMCQSPISKNAQEIMDKINTKSPVIESRKESIKQGIDNIKKSLEQIEKSLNANALAIANTNANININTNAHHHLRLSTPEVLNTTDSIQSTIRESAMYRKEAEKLSLYLKNYYTINKQYPPSSKLTFYKYGRLIGRGAFGKVNLALHLISGRLVAIKSFSKAKNTSRHSQLKIKNEIDILKRLRHPFISQILDHFETDKHRIIVMEYTCGDLLSFIRKRGKLSEPIAKVIFKQLIEGLKYIHSKRIAHRDIKLDNILIDIDNTVKICDFGVSKMISKGTNSLLYDHCGTPAYIAPDIFNKKGYDGFACDIWSAGVTLYYMLSGNQPFKGNNIQGLNAAIVSGKYARIETLLSIEARDLINGLLQVDAKKRLGIKQILAHPWLNAVKVGVKYRSQLTLFTNAEKALLNKHNVDYLNGNREDIIENFTMRNLDTVLEEENMNENYRSLILAPFNTVDNGNDCHCDNRGSIKGDESILGLSLGIENGMIKYCGKVKQLNIKYELNNNGEFDNGVIITQPDKGKDKDKGKGNKELHNHISTSSSEGLSNNSLSPPRLELEDLNEGTIYDKDQIVFSDNEDDYYDAIINNIEINIGYKRKYLIDCLKRREVNYATATYYLLSKTHQMTQHKYK